MARRIRRFVNLKKAVAYTIAITRCRSPARP